MNKMIAFQGGNGVQVNNGGPGSICRQGCGELLGRFATSRAGHDKSELYVIVAQEAGFVYLCDGKYRLLGRPKKKNLKHIQIINRTVDQELLRRLINKETIFDEEIKYAIKQYLDQQVSGIN